MLASTTPPTHRPILKALTACVGLVLFVTMPDPVVGQALLGTLAAIGGGLAAGGIAGGFLSRPDRKSPDEFIARGNRKLLNRADELNDPSYGFGQYRQLARDMAGSADQTLQATAANGGSERMARVRQQEQVQQAANDIMERFGQFRLNTNQQANRLMQAGVSNQMQAQQMSQKQNLARDRATMSLFNNIASMGGQIAGTATGQLGAQSMSSGPSFGQMRQMGGGYYNIPGIGGPPSAQ